MPEFYMIFALKIYFSRIRGGASASGGGVLRLTIGICYSYSCIFLQ